MDRRLKTPVIFSFIINISCFLNSVGLEIILKSTKIKHYSPLPLEKLPNLINRPCLRPITSQQAATAPPTLTSCTNQSGWRFQIESPDTSRSSRHAWRSRWKWCTLLMEMQTACLWNSELRLDPRRPWLLRRTAYTASRTAAWRIRGVSRHGWTRRNTCRGRQRWPRWSTGSKFRKESLKGEFIHWEVCFLTERAPSTGHKQQEQQRLWMFLKHKQCILSLWVKYYSWIKIIFAFPFTNME